MPEPLTTQLVVDLMQKLVVAFPSRNVAGQNITHTADVYRNGLRGLSGEAVRAAVDRAIQESEYFPKVAQLREFATSWQRYNQAKTDPVFPPDELWCPNCQSRAEVVTRWRPQVDKQFRWIGSADRMHVLLESYQRLQCKCATACIYVAEIDKDPPMMALSRLRPKTMDFGPTSKVPSGLPVAGSVAAVGRTTVSADPTDERQRATSDSPAIGTAR